MFSMVSPPANTDMIITLQIWDGSTYVRWLLNHCLLNDNTAKLLASHDTGRQNSAFLIKSYHRKVLRYFSEKQIGIQSAVCYCNFIEFIAKAFFPPSWH